jgi:hypothetical protein
MTEETRSGAHSRDCASRDRLRDPGPENEGGTFDERGWYRPPCDCSGASQDVFGKMRAVEERLDQIAEANAGELMARRGVSDAVRSDDAA